MIKNKNGPNVVLRKGLKAIYLRSLDGSPRKVIGAGVIPAGGVFKISAARAQSLLAVPYFRPALKEEVADYLIKRAGPKGLDTKVKAAECKNAPATKKDLASVLDLDAGLYDLDRPPAWAADWAKAKQVEIAKAEPEVKKEA